MLLSQAEVHMQGSRVTGSGFWVSMEMETAVQSSSPSSVQFPCIPEADEQTASDGRKTVVTALHPVKHAHVIPCQRMSTKLRILDPLAPDPLQRHVFTM